MSESWLAILAAIVGAIATKILDLLFPRD